MLNENQKKLFRHFMSTCEDVGCSKGDLKKILSHLAYCKAGQTTEIEDRWDVSLLKGQPDYSIYESVEYLAEAWACWSMYSRKHLLKIQKSKCLQDLKFKSVVDLGCGLGYTTASLKQIFGAEEVIGTNVGGSFQAKFVELMAKRNGFQVNAEPSDKHPRLVFASEYFEHFERPIEHLDHVLKKWKPDCMIIANTFTSPSAGHFRTYRLLDFHESGSSVSRIFNGYLRKAGYYRLLTHFWNNRPSVWEKRRET